MRARPSIPPPRPRRARSGQALLEMTVALVAVVVVVAALLQVTALSREHLRMINAARAEAAMYAMGTEYRSGAPMPELLLDWELGPDERPMTADDRAVIASAEGVRSRVLRHARPEALNRIVPGNPVTGAAWTDPLPEAFGLVRSVQLSDPVPMIPIARHLLYDAEFIRVEGDATTVWLQGIE
jgi:hypothetical protein